MAFWPQSSSFVASSPWDCKADCETSSGKWKLRYISALWSVKRKLSSRSVNILTLLTFKYWLLKLYQLFDLFLQDCLLTPWLLTCSVIWLIRTLWWSSRWWDCHSPRGCVAMHVNFWAADSHDSVFLTLGVAFPEPQAALDAVLKAPLHVQPGFISGYLVSLCLFSWGNPL